MKDFVFADDGQEGFIAMAKKLNYTELVLISTKKLAEQRVLELKNGCDIELIFMQKSEFGLGTKLTQVSRSVKWIYDNEFEEDRDFIHQRRGGLNHVIAKDLVKKNVGVIFDYGGLQNLKNWRLCQIIGRMKQNMIVCRKFGVKYEVVSMAKDVLQMRDVKDVTCFENELICRS